MAEGFLMYDPRVKKEVESSNPAIVLAHMVRNLGGVGLMTQVEEADFWAKVAVWADWLDEQVGNEESVPDLSTGE